MAFPFHFSLSFCSFFFRFLLSSVEPPYLFLAVVFLSFSSLFSFCYLGPSFFFLFSKERTSHGGGQQLALLYMFLLFFDYIFFFFLRHSSFVRNVFFFFSFEFSSSLPAGFYFLMLFIFVSYPALFSFFFVVFFPFFTRTKALHSSGVPIVLFFFDRILLV